ncbi:sodium-dependent transporter [Kushneria konosiri]|uniref:Sodium-dependent transporter n=1 Tax=Kushneria konosiri TaxID=698828 RepID=A0A2Z2HA04_9GAMM|nr:sodium-dependent transporter [Kushneria konosiri]ARS52180.1 sodium-dependent transporter [Kushneria konosiri]
MSEVVERWGSRRAFIIAVTGAAVGLGNIWRFPWMTGENGGAAFLVLYVLFLALLGLPVMVAEIMIGRAGRRTPMQALTFLAREAGKSRHWGWLGLFGGITLFFILSFYSVVSGWSIEYLVDALSGSFASRSPEQIGGAFEAFLASPGLVLLNHSIFLFLTMSVVALGVGGGLERLNNLLMPLLYLLLILLVGYAVTTSGFTTALVWLFKPDLSAVTLMAVFNAMGHAFFTLAVGAGALMAYGAYMPDDQSLPRAVVTVAILDVAVALLAGIAIFSIVFSQGMDPASGPGLMFVTLPIAFADLPGGALWLGGFFVLLLLATWTSSINLAEPMVAMLGSIGMARPLAALIIGIGVWLMGVPSALSFSIWADVRVFNDMTLFDLATTLPIDIMLPIGGLLIAIFAVWIVDAPRAIEAIGAGERFYRVWRAVVRWVSIPLLVLVLLGFFLMK